MFSLKDKVILIYMSFIWIYLAFRTNHTAHFYADYDNILLTFIILGGWFILFSNRTFVMTRKKLSNYYLESNLEYKPFIKNELVEKIFVKLQHENDWYELDYILTIPKNSSFNQFNKFAIKNGTVRNLLTTMNINANDGYIRHEYNMQKTEYYSIIYLTLFIILLAYLIYVLSIFKQF